MASSKLIELWQKVAADLRRARGTLPPEAEANDAVVAYQEFLDHNELELACDMLATYAEVHPVSCEFWRALRDASVKMQLPDRATRYEGRATPALGFEPMAFTLNYDDAIHLDAEALAEGGIAGGYESVLPELRKFIANPAKIDEHRDDDAPSYSVICGDAEFEIYSPELDEGGGNSWGRATVALFAIVNEQLKNSSHRFYAINGGNDLFGMFLTPAQAKEAQKSLPNKSDWPYLPKDEEPYFGQYH